MRKRDMMARIEALEKRVAQLEARGIWPHGEPWKPEPWLPFQVTWASGGGMDYTYEGILLEDRDAYAG